MQYQVPQFIDTEDKVVGPFSLRQFAYVGAAALVSAICYFFLQTWLFAIVALVLVGGSLALSFVKINGRPLIKVAVSAFNYLLEAADVCMEGGASGPATAAIAAPALAAVRELPPIADDRARGIPFIKAGRTCRPARRKQKRPPTRQFVEKKMAERYQIFQRQSGDRMAARRVDYR